MMNKMTKGALAIGIGSAMLLGGGGTLAVWNQTENVNAGQIASGDLELITQTGVWTNAYGTKVDLDPTNKIADYKVVPGDVLTYSQTMDVKLTGDLMQAKLSIQGLPTSTFVAQNVTIDNVVVQDASGNNVKDAILKSSNEVQKITASAKFTFKQDTDLRSSTNALADFANVSYKLDQQALPAPAATPAATPAAGK
ncbi:alternate-type signal peptide domain-containing protein [Arthrobacter sp. zg-Y826]|uniref:alternate-type signal peptide domain-containing protein n=1 Tax=Arthrobacter jinronghuae TaxID=2964609 RepID=UPI00210517DA|nr:alternate-type signal peptide domain-containing protein [Arthrobacter jinronghuae]MCQ1957278.1 alternate-type signal peptide domain-containing protein [Arthrobacter jinronghuae]